FGRGHSWATSVDALARLAAVDRKAVIAAAERYYGDDYLAFHSRVGFPGKDRLEKPVLKPIKPAAGRRSAFARRLHERPDPPASPRYVDFARAIDRAMVAPGVVVEASAKPFTELYTLELRFGVGRYAIRELGVVGDYLKSVGTRERDADALRAALFELATTLEVEATEEALIFRLEGPEAGLGASLALVDEILRGPAEDRAALRRVRRERWGRALVERRQPSVIADALREYASYGELSTYLRDVGPQELRGLQPRDLIKALDRAQGHAVTVRYVGRRSAAEVAREVGAAVRFRDKLAPAKPRVVRERIVRERDRVFLVKRRQSLQTHVYALVEGKALAGDERVGLAGFNEYLGGGMGGLIFQEIRELRALAYSARGRYYEGVRAGAPGALLAYVGTQGDKTLDALDVLAELIRELPEREGRIESVRAALLRSTEAAYPGFRQLQETVEAWRLLGFGEDPRRGLMEGLEELDFAAIRRFHAAHVAGRPLTVMIVGDPRRFDADSLERFGEVEVVSLRDLFAR
ncbi:MAG: insulinase family protein, partial [Myxococcales bacterium]|nr:insulinase family protein [Myxococcales bacterium]